MRIILYCGIELDVNRGPGAPPPIVGHAASGGGGGAVPLPSGPTPSDADFAWTVDRDIDALDAGNDEATGLWGDGATIWVAQNGDGAGDSVYAYDLASGERLEDREFELDGANLAPRGLWSDRETIWVSDSGRESLFAYGLESGERLMDRDIKLSDANDDPRGIWSDRITIWVLDDRDESVYLYDLGSGEQTAVYELDSANDDPHGIWSDGVAVWVSDGYARKLLAYRLEDGALVREGDEDFTKLTPARNNSPRGIWSDGDVMYVVAAAAGVCERGVRGAGRGRHLSRHATARQTRAHVRSGRRGWRQRIVPTAPAIAPRRPRCARLCHLAKVGAYSSHEHRKLDRKSCATGHGPSRR